MNEVRVSGAVMRDAEAGTAKNGDRVIDFALKVDRGNGQFDIIDCRATEQSGVIDELDGYVEADEILAVSGMLERQTCTDKSRLAGAMVEVRVTKTIVMVTEILEA